MTSYSYGNYGFIQHEKMNPQPLFLIDTGIECRRDSDYCFDNGNRPSYGGYLLQYTLKGSGCFVKDGRTHILKEGFCFFSKIPENSSYYYDSSIGGDWDFFYLHFDGDAAKHFYDAINGLTGGVFYLSPEKSPVHLYFHLIENYKRKGFLDLYEGGEFLYRFLSGILRELEAPTDNASPVILSATAFMRKNFSTISGITDISEYCNITPEYLCRLFKKEKGQSPLQFLTKLRMEHALFLLLNTSDSVEKIAASCGFMNGNYFAKVFRKMMHCSPNEYRKR